MHSGQARRCTRYVNVGGFTHADVAGRDRLHFGGEIGGRALAAGAYELQATPSAAGRSGATVTVTFRIVA